MSCSQLWWVLTHLWLLLLALAPGREQSGEPPKAALLLSPPWSTTFKGQTVTLTCMGFHSSTKGDTYWLRGQDIWQRRSEKVTITLSGDYRCKTSGSSFSEPVHVEFSSDQLILQAPHPVFEGDDVILRCLGEKDGTIIKKTYYKDGKEIRDSYNLDQITINSVSMNPGEYHCTAVYKKLIIFESNIVSKPLRIQVQELFPHPVLTVSPSQPTEGGPVTLTCETQLPPQKPYVWLQFCFYRDVQILGSGCSNSPELQIPTIWAEDSGSYWCQAKTVAPNITKMSQRSQIRVQRVPVSNVSLEIQPPGGQLIEGHSLVLICSVTKGTGTITFSWHRDGTGIVGRKTQRSLMAELQVPGVKEQDTGRYYCSADNSEGPILSNKVRVTVRTPVSSPAITIWSPRAPVVVGDMVRIQCKTLRGSPPILYRFYHKNVTVGNSSDPSGRGASFNISLTAEHSGHYFCEADNGLGSQHSRRVSLKVTVPVSSPVFTLRSPEAQPVIGDIVELHCEALRGSPPILYRFYHENVTLGNSSAPLGGGASLKLLLSTEHAGNYSCEADNGLGARHSEVLTLSVIGISRNRTGPATAGVTGGSLGLAVTAALLWYFRIYRKSGRTSAPGTSSSSVNQEPSLSTPSTTDPEVPVHSEPLTPVYSNVNPRSVNLIYSQIQSIQYANGNPANSARTHEEEKGPIVIYSELRARQDDGATQTSRRESSCEDGTGNYENVP